MCHIEKLIVDVKVIVDVCREKEPLLADDKITYKHVCIQKLISYLVCVVLVEGLMVVELTHWTLWTVVHLQY